MSDIMQDGALVRDQMGVIERLRSELAAKDARIAEQTSAAIGLAAVIEMERARAEQAEAQLAAKTVDLKAANDAADIWFGKAKDMEARLAEAKSALSAKDATIWDLRKLCDEASDIVRPLCARISSLEKSLAEAEAQLAESEASCDRLRSAYDDVRALNAQLAVNHADIVTPLRVELAEAKSALSAMEAKVTRTEGQWAADIRMWQQAVGRLEQAYFRISSLEKSVTVLRAENVELREIAGGLSYYADGHGLQEKWAAELRSLNQRLGALAQATDQPTTP